MDQQASNQRAALVTICAMAIIGTVDAFVASIGEAIGIWQFLVIRAFFLTPVILFVMVPLGVGQLFVRSWRAVLTRSFFVGTGLFLYFAALGIFPLAHAFAGLYASPIFIVVLSLLVLRQWVGWLRSTAAVIGFSGILIVLEFEIHAVDLMLFIPMTAGLLYGVGQMITGRYCREESTTALMLGLTLVHLFWGAMGLMMVYVLPQDSLLEFPAFLQRGWNWSFLEVWPVLLLHLCGSVIITLLMTNAYKWGETSFVSIFENTVFIFGPLFAYFYFGQALTAGQIGGIFMIALAGVGISLSRNHNRQKPLKTKNGPG